jgi:hypothetical protein
VEDAPTSRRKANDLQLGYGASAPVVEVDALLADVLELVWRQSRLDVGQRDEPVVVADIEQVGHGDSGKVVAWCRRPGANLEVLLWSVVVELGGRVFVRNLTEVLELVSGPASKRI